MTPSESSSPSAPARRPSAGWLVSPTYDLLFLANVAWPLLLLPGLLRSDGHLQTEFWQIYFLTTPHRWITLLLVATDPDRRAGRDRLFIGLAVLAAAAVGGIWVVTGSLTCLLLADYIWNSWHFASQHQGILRLYARTGGSSPEWLERHLLRAFLTYTLLRTAGWTTGWFEADSSRRAWLTIADTIALVVPVAILLANFVGWHRGRIGKTAYLVSLLSLYTGLLLALRNDWTSVVFALTAASSTMHAIEYLAVVTHYARRRTTVGGDGPFRVLAKHWTVVFSAYLLALGLLGTWIGESGGIAMRIWIAVNVWSAFLHYAYDGLIWKLRRPDTAKALEASP